MTETNWELVDNECCEKFESAWLSGNPIEIDVCLPEPAAPEFLPTLEELVHIEMEFSWRAMEEGGAEATVNNSTATVETYIQRFQDLDSDEIILRLVEQEIRCRQRTLGEVKFEEFSSRFPSLTAGINNLKTFIEGESPTGNSRNKDMSVGEHVGRYLIKDRQGEGGFGLVWQADDPKLGRTVAIKQLSGRLARDEEQRKRFFNEARIAARLEHPGVVPVYDVEPSEESSPYYTMKLVQGKTLDENIQSYHQTRAENPDERIDALRLLNGFVSVCKAMQYAHDNGVIHRDLKPQNVILGDYGETIILDWGLAKLVDDEDQASFAPGNPLSIQMTAPGSVMGTPAYMSPEQARGEVATVGFRSDVFSLGVILFQILTGRLPFQGQTGEEMIADLLRGEAPEPRTIDSTISKPLQAICMRAMHADTDLRFQSVKELSVELDRLLADEPIASYPESWMEKSLRWARKHRTWVTVAAATIVVFAIGSMVASLLINEQRKRAEFNEGKARDAERLEKLAKEEAIEAKEKESQAKRAAISAADREKRAREEEQEQRELAQWQLSRLFIKDGLRSLDELDVGTAALWFSRSLKLNEGNQDEANDRLRVNATMRRQPKLAEMFFCDEQKFGALVGVQFSPDEQSALIMGKKRFETRELKTREITKEFEWSEPTSIRYSRNVQFVVTHQVSVESLKNPSLIRTDLQTGERVECRLNPDDDSVNYSCSHPIVSSDGNRLVACISKAFGTVDEQHFLAIWNIEEPNQPKFSEFRKRKFSSCEFSRDDKLIVTGGGDHSACIWDVESAERKFEFDHSNFYPRTEGADYRLINDAKFSPDGKFIAAASSDNVAYVWNLEENEMVHQLDHGPNRNFSSVTRVEFAEEGNRVATTDLFAITRVWNVKTGQLLGKFDDFQGSITDLSLSSDGLVVSASNDGYCKVWAASGVPIMPSLRHSSTVVAANMNSKKSQFLTACSDQTIRYWDNEQMQEGNAFRRLPGRERSAYDKFSISPDGKFLVTSNRQLMEAKVQVWDAASLDQIGKDIELPNTVGKLVFSQDNERLLVTSTTALKTTSPHFAQVIDLASGKELGKRLVHDAEIVEAGFLPDGNQVFTASKDGKARVWQVSNSSKVKEFEHDSAVKAACLVNEGSVLVCGCQDKRVFFWSITEGDSHFETLIHEWPIQNLVASVDSRRLLVHGYWSQTAASVWLVDLSTGKRVGEPIAHRNFRPPSFRPDSRYFSSLGNNEISIHDSNDGTPLSRIQHDAGILGFSWHPTKDRFVSSSEDKTLRIWDIHSGEPTAPRIKCAGVPVEPTFDSSGKILINGFAFSTTVQVLDSETGELLGPDLIHPGLAEPIAFSPTRSEILVGGFRLTVWNLEPYGETPARAESLAELLSGHRVDKIGGLIPLSLEELRTRFLQLRRDLDR